MCVNFHINENTVCSEEGELCSVQWPKFCCCALQMRTLAALAQVTQVQPGWAASTGKVQVASSLEGDQGAV